MKYIELDTTTVDGIRISTLQFSLPLDYSNPKDETTISVVIKVVNNYKRSNSSPVSETSFDLDRDITKNADNILLFLQGGPGFPSPFPTSKSNPSYLKSLLDRGYTVLLLDQRGTGLSSAIDTDLILSISRTDTSKQFQYIKNFRADSIVHDCENIRLTLFPNNKLTLLGQSFGGFTSITYASLYPDSLLKIMLTGGLPPLVIDTVDDVYEATFQRTKERNIAFYKKFPQDKIKIKNIVEFLQSNEIILPNGGLLTVDRFRQLGLSFGGSGGTFDLHVLITKMHTELENRNKTLSYFTKMTIMNYLGFETNILYFLFQEAIYLNGPGKSSNWAADRILAKHADEMDPNAETFLFTGEIVTKSMLNDYKMLQPLTDLANYIHKFESWSTIYDIDALKSITWEKLPIAAAVYLDDQYVDYNLGCRNKDIFEYKPFVTNQLFHNGIRASSEEVISRLHIIFEHGDYM